MLRRRSRFRAKSFLTVAVVSLQSPSYLSTFPVFAVYVGHGNIIRRIAIYCTWAVGLLILTSFFSKSVLMWEVESYSTGPLVRKSPPTTNLRGPKFPGILRSLNFAGIYIYKKVGSGYAEVRVEHALPHTKSLAWAMPAFPVPCHRAGVVALQVSISEKSRSYP